MEGKMNVFQQNLPMEDEDYMNDRQLEYFRERLLQWRKEIVTMANTTRSGMQNDRRRSADILDLATSYIRFNMDTGNMERQQENLSMIDAALARMDSGDYGYCILSGEEIGLRRLTVQPAATLCIEVQEMLERNTRIAGQRVATPDCMV
jgi:DnaK suppressor protein